MSDRAAHLREELIDAYWRAYDSYLLRFPQSSVSEADTFARFIVEQLAIAY